MTLRPKDIVIRPMVVADAPAVAVLHVRCIDTGFISSLGVGFVTTLYQAIGDSGSAFGLVAEVQGQVVGFVAFTTDIRKLYREVLWQGGGLLGLLLLRRLCSWSRLNRMWHTLRYPYRAHSVALPSSELLSLAVGAGQRGYGIGGQLLDKGLTLCLGREVQQLKVCVGGQRLAAQALYEKTGFQLACEVDRSGDSSKIYVLDLASSVLHCQFQNALCSNAY